MAYRNLKRDKWPAPENNPILVLLRRQEEWISNYELATALGLASGQGNKSVVGHWPDILEELGATESKLMRPESRFGGRAREVRVFSKKAAIIAALRARTINARAFQEWLTNRAIELEAWNG